MFKGKKNPFDILKGLLMDIIELCILDQVHLSAGKVRFKYKNAIQKLLSRKNLALEFKVILITYGMLIFHI